jgi:two-component system response regulator DevR
MVTTFDDADARMAAVMAGASGFVLKQIRGDDLVDAVRKVAAGAELSDNRAIVDAARRAQDAGDVTMDPRLASLTAQEQRILDLISDGLTNRQIGERLGIGEKTVKNYVTRLLLKLGLVRRTQAAVFGARARGF